MINEKIKMENYYKKLIKKLKKYQHYCQAKFINMNILHMKKY